MINLSFFTFDQCSLSGILFPYIIFTIDTLQGAINSNKKDPLVLRYLQKGYRGLERILQFRRRGTCCNVGPARAASAVCVCNGDNKGYFRTVYTKISLFFFFSYDSSTHTTFIVLLKRVCELVLLPSLP